MSYETDVSAFMYIGAGAMDHWQANINHSHMHRDLEASHTGTAH